MRFAIVSMIIGALTLVEGASSGPAKAAEVGRMVAVDKATVADRRKPEPFGSLLEGRVSVVAFLGVECPVAIAYAIRLEELARKWKDRGVVVIGVMSNQQDDKARIEGFVGDLRLTYRVIPDGGAVIADLFGAKRTPEVFVLDAQDVVRYHGRIDDQVGVAGKRPQATRHDLEIAVEEMLAGKPVSVASTPVAGCFINRPAKPAAAADGAGGPTYAEHVAPIIFSRCTRCHRPGEIGPFPLRSFEEVHAWAATIRETVIERRMPPWDADPRFGTFSNDIRLTDEEIATVVAWVDAGAPRGDPATAPPVPDFPSGWQLGEPDLVVTLPEYTVRPGPKDYFPRLQTRIHLEKDQWIQAIEVRPGNPRVLHHLGLSFGDVPVMGSDDADPLAIDDLTLVDLFGLAAKFIGGNVGFLTAWGVGTPPIVYPEGMGTPIKAESGGTVITAGMHYHPTANTVETDQTRIGLHFGKGEMKKHVMIGRASSLSIDIPAGEDNWPTAGSWTFDEDVHLILLVPHMHFRGKNMLYRMHYPDGRVETLLSVPHYNYNYQWTYVLEKPHPVPRGSRLEMVAHHDNSAANPNNPDPGVRVNYGIRSQDEMAAAIFLYYADDGVRPRRPDSRQRIREYVAANDGARVFEGGAGGPFGLLPARTMLVLPEQGDAAIGLAMGGALYEIPAGPVAWNGRAFEAAADNAYGKVRVKGTLLDEGRVKANLRVIDVTNPFMRFTLGRGITFDGRRISPPQGVHPEVNADR